jgi:hypothetical protein
LLVIIYYKIGYTLPVGKSLEKLKTEEKSNWGGARTGAGRKPKLQYEVRELFNLAIDDYWEDIIKVLHYHIRRGDKEVMKWVIEQRVGKAPQTLDVNARGAFLNVTDEVKSTDNKIDIMEMAKRISAELKVLKTG